MIETLAGSDLIACEDTRVTGKLLRHYAITTPVVSYNEHNAGTAGPEILQQVGQGRAVTLVSDAGTPLISDPGFRLVEEARRRDLPIIPLPGPSAPLAALIASGLPSQSWRFCGFLPSRQTARRDVLGECLALRETTIFFESPKRLVRTLTDIAEVLGPGRIICVARELTKLHEEVITGTVPELLARYREGPVRGEIVILIGPAPLEVQHDPRALLAELLETLPIGKAAAQAAQLTGLPRRELYTIALSLKERP